MLIPLTREDALHLTREGMGTSKSLNCAVLQALVERFGGLPCLPSVQGLIMGLR
jgi:hypothetical protein